MNEVRKKESTLMERVESMGAAVFFITLVLPWVLASPASAASGPAAGSSCTSRCGNISIAYPFGVEPGCYHAGGGFNLTCRQQGDPPSPGLFLGDGTVQVLHISVENSTVRINSPGVQSEDGSVSGNRTWGGGLPQSGPYFLSESTSCSRR